METTELVRRCRAQQKLQRKPDAVLTLTIPGRWGTRTHARLFGRLGPEGVIVADALPRNPRAPRLIAQFKADAVLTYLAQQGVNVDDQGTEQAGGE
jgi:hypothetical protein